MDFQKSTDINMDIHGFWMSVFNYPHKRGYPHWYPSTDIHARTFRNGYPLTINLHKLISMFMDISLQLSMLLWISIWIYLDFYGYPCIDLLWILDPGLVDGREHCCNNQGWRVFFLLSLKIKDLVKRRGNTYKKRLPTWETDKSIETSPEMF